MKLLIIGAFGTVGRHLVPELVKRGHVVTISSREPNKVCPWPELKIRRYTLDLLQSETLAPALQGIDVVYYLMHGMSDGERHTPRELWAARNLAQAAEKAGVGRIIYLGSLLSKRPGSEHMQARLATGKILASTSIPVTELRAGIIIAPGSAAFEVMRDMVGHLPFVFAPLSIHNRNPPIAVADVVHYLAELLKHTTDCPQILDAAGPEWLGYAQMMHRMANKLGRFCRVITIPGLPLSWAGMALGIVTSVPSPLAKALIAGLAEPLDANPQPLRTLIPRQLMSFEQALDKVLTEEKIEAYPNRWQDGIPQFRNFSPLHGFYAKSAKLSTRVPVPCRYVWQVINQIGKEQRYFYFDSLWAMREWIDWLFGGPGREYGRSCDSKFRVGDKVDSWTVLSVEDERLLVLKFGMRAPGGGGMQICIEPESPASCRLSIELFWHPAGFWGLAYWYFFAPWHRLLLKGMCRNMKRQACWLAHEANLQQQ